MIEIFGSIAPLQELVSTGLPLSLEADSASEGFDSYELIDDATPVIASVPRGMYRCVFAVGSMQRGLVRVLRGEPCSALTHELWLLGVPWGRSLSMGEYAQVPGYYWPEFRQVQGFLSKQALGRSSPLSPSELAASSLRFVIADESTPNAPSLRLAGEHGSIVILYSKGTPFGDRALRVTAMRLAHDRERTGVDAPKLLVACADPASIDAAQSVTSNLALVPEAFLAEGPAWQEMFTDIGSPGGFVLQGNGEVGAAIWADDVFQSYLHQLDLALSKH
ncbi:MAG: hypothetical protein H6828_10775 [Planctomycetes bacterium]|nr:hypothetical protein [Planctomycetota bacterium]